MANGEMLRELRTMAEADKLQTATALRLILSAMAELYERTARISDTLECSNDDLVKTRAQYSAERADQVRMIGDLSTKVDQLTKKLDNVGTEVETVMDRTNTLATRVNDITGQVERGTVAIRGNVAYKMGKLIQEHPRLALAATTVVVLLSNLWFITSFRRAVLLLLNVPQEIINFLAPLP